MEDRGLKAKYGERGGPDHEGQGGVDGGKREVDAWEGVVGVGGLGLGCSEQDRGENEGLG